MRILLPTLNAGKPDFRTSFRAVGREMCSSSANSAIVSVILGGFVRGLRLIFFRWNAIEHRFTSEMETQGHIRHADTPDANLFCVSYYYIETICFADLDMSGMSSRETPCRSGDSATYSPTFGRQAACQKGGSSSTTVQPPNVSCAGGGIRSQPYCRPYLANLRALRNFCQPLISPLAIPLSTISRISRVS